MMLILACFVLAMGIATCIEIDSDLGGQWRGGAVMASGIWTTLFVISAEDETAIAGFVGYMLVMLTFLYLFGFVIMMIDKARDRWGTWRRV